MTDLVPITGLAGEVAQYGPTRRVQVLIALWLQSLRSENTVDAYERDLKQWIRFCDEAGVDPLEALRAHVDVWATRGAGFPKPPAETSKSRRLSAVASWYRYLVKSDVVLHNPVDNVTRPYVDGAYTATRGLSDVEAGKVLDVAAEAGPRDLAVITLLLLSGLRRAEVVSADVEDLGYERGHRTLDLTRKGGGQQRIPLSPETVAALAAYLQDRKTGPLITTRHGGRASVYQLFRTVRKVALAAGLPHAEEVSPHSLRHAFATLSLDAGKSLRDVQSSMGHKDPKTTMRYDHARNQLERNTTYALTKYLRRDRTTDDEETAS